MWIIPTVLIIGAIVENIWPLFAGYSATPPGKVFLGTVHHPFDYFYYLSQFAQGTTHWLTARDLYTSERLPATLVGWSNVLMGKLGFLVGLSPQATYGISVIVLTIVICIAAYRLSRAVLPTKFAAFTAVALFAVYHAFPKSEHGSWTFYDYWNNFANPSVRFGGVPHQLLIVVVSVVAATLMLTKRKSSPWITYALVGITGLVLASLQPVLWAFMVGCFGLSIGIFGRLKRYKFSDLVTLCLPLTFFAVGGAPAALYLAKLFSGEPFIQLRQWESAQQMQLSLVPLLLSTGPVAVIALASLPSFLSAKTVPRISMAVFPLLSIGVFVSPLPAALGVTQVRFMSALTILSISIIAAHGILALDRLCATLPKFHLPRYAVSATIVLFITAFLLPSHMRTLAMTTDFQTDNGYQYLNTSDYGFLLQAGRLATEQDTFLIIWPYNLDFPGITGKKSYNGHPLLTVHADAKDSMAEKLFDGKLSENEVRQFFTDAHITYVIAYTWTPALGSYPFLQDLRSSGALILYRVETKLL